MTHQINPVSGSRFTLKYKELFWEAVPHMMRGKVTKLDAKDPNVGIDLDTRSGSKSPDEDDATVAEGVTQERHCFYKDGRTRYFISTFDDEFQMFKDKLFRECQHQNILCDENGYILDGAARWVALTMLNIEPKYTIVGNLGDDAAKITFIRSQKLCRHHLTEQERMSIVKAEIQAHPKRAIAWTASLLGVSRTTVTKYRKELEGLGLVPVASELETRDGRLAEHESYSKEMKARDDADSEAKKKSRSDAAAETRKTNFEKQVREQFKDHLLHSRDTARSLANMARYAEALPKLQKREKEEAAQVLKALASKLGTSVPVTSAPSISALAVWNVETVAVKKTRNGVTIQIDTAQLPDTMDVAQVPPGQVTVNGKVISIEAGKALLLLSDAQNAPQDAVVVPSEDDQLMMRSAGFQIDPDEMPNASDN